MPRLDFICGNGHTFERDVPLSQWDHAQTCVCGAIAQQWFPYAPGMLSPSGAVATAEREAYLTHNVTYSREIAPGREGVGFMPNAIDSQCTCGDCSRHRKRAFRTEVAEPARKNKRVAKEVRL